MRGHRSASCLCLSLGSTTWFSSLPGRAARCPADMASVAPPGRQGCATQHTGTAPFGTLGRPAVTDRTTSVTLPPHAETHPVARIERDRSVRRANRRTGNGRTIVAKRFGVGDYQYEVVENWPTFEIKGVA